MGELFAAKGITPEFIQLECYEVFKRCMSKEPVLEWDSSLRAWVESGQWQFDAKGALKALDQMATILGMKRPDSQANSGGESVEQYLRRTGGNAREY